MKGLTQIIAAFTLVIVLFIAFWVQAFEDLGMIWPPLGFIFMIWAFTIVDLTIRLFRSESSNRKAIGGAMMLLCLAAFISVLYENEIDPTATEYLKDLTFLGAFWVFMENVSIVLLLAVPGQKKKELLSPLEVEESPA